MSETDVSKKRKLIKPTVLTLLAVVVILICAALPQKIFKMKDDTADGKFVSVSGMDKRIANETTIKNANSIISTLSAFIPAGEGVLIDEEELRSHYLYGIVQSQLVKLVEHKLIQEPLYEQLVYELVETEQSNSSVELYITEPLAIEEPYEWISVKSGSKTSIEMLYNKEIEKAIQINLRYDSEYQWADFYSEEAMKRYISWLGLEGALNWEITDSSGGDYYSISGISPNIPLNLSVTRSVDESTCNLSYYVIVDEKYYTSFEETETDY